MKRIYIILSLLLFFGACKHSNKKINGYLIKGTIKGAIDSTKIFIQYKDSSPDSTFVINEKFQFEGSITEPEPVFILIKENNDFKSIWLENNIIEIRGKSGSFKKALITGSPLTKQADSLENSFRDFLKIKDSIYKLSVNQNISDSSRRYAKEILKKNFSDRRKIDKEFIRKNPFSIISAYKLDFYSSAFGKELTKKLYNNFSDGLKKSSYGKSIHEFLTLNQRMGVGDKYVDFSALNTSNSIVNISDFRKGVVFLEFWNTHCSPCIKEFSFLKKAYSDFKHKGFEIISISDDKSIERWKNMIGEKNLSWINLVVNDSLKSKSHKIYGISGYPTNFLIDRDGIIIAKELRGESLIKKLNEIL